MKFKYSRYLKDIPAFSKSVVMNIRALRNESTEKFKPYQETLKTKDKKKKIFALTSGSQSPSKYKCSNPTHSIESLTIL